MVLKMAKNKKLFVVDAHGQKYYGPLMLQQAKKVSSIVKSRYVEYYKAYKIKVTDYVDEVGFITDDPKMLKDRSYRSIKSLFDQVQKDKEKSESIRIGALYRGISNIIRVIKKTAQPHYFVVKNINSDHQYTEHIGFISELGRKGKEKIKQMVETAEYEVEKAENELEVLLKVAKEVGIKTFHV
jgi:hypothetical protein